MENKEKACGTIDIICPLYNGEKYIEDLQKSIEKQTKYNSVKNIRYIITKGEDNTESLVKDISQKNEKIMYKVIEPTSFSHSLTRENEAYESSADIIVFITQDVKIINKDWLEKLVKPIEDGEVEASYSRQICDDKTSIEYYTRQKNYPSDSRIKSKEDLEELGMNTFFYSDASSAISKNVFEELHGYNQKKLPTNEDMYIAYKLITNGYKIKYCADSEVVHSHNFTFKETFNRYKAYGEFLKQEPQINIKSTKAGGGLAKYILLQALKDRNWRIIFRFFPDMCARFVGMKVGNK